MANRKTDVPVARVRTPVAPPVAKRVAAAETVPSPLATLKDKIGTPAPIPERKLRMPAGRWVEQAMRLTPPEVKSTARNIFLSKIGVFVFLPTILMIFYVYVYATPRYISELQLTYQSNDPTSSGLSASAGILSSIMGASSGSVDMSSVLQTYLTSADVAQIVDKEVQFRKHYSASSIDWLDRLSPTASAEKFLTYFNRRVTVSRQFGGFVTVDAEAFDPAFAQKVGQALAHAADVMVAAMMEKARSDAVGLAVKELRRTEDVLQKTTLDLTNFRNKHSDVNVQTSSNSVDTVVSSLEAQVSQANSDLANARSFLSDSAPSVVTLNARITALKNEINAERKRLGYADGTAKPASGKMPYSQVVAEYTALETEQKFATDSYVSAKKAYDMARAMAAQKAGYVVSFVPPNRPQSSTSPDPMTYILSAFLVSLGGYMAVTLAIGAFQDRAGA